MWYRPAAEDKKHHAKRKMKPEKITEQAINLAELLAAAHHPAAGAVVLFSGEAREHNEGKNVAYLEYEAFVPVATGMITQILEEATIQWGLQVAVCQHRIGKVGISEPAVCVITASVHRKEAYQANQYIIHRVKHEVPIWKKEFLEDGTYIWGGNCNCPSPDQHVLPDFM